MTVVLVWILPLLLALPAAVFSNVRSVDIQLNHTIEYCTPFPKEYSTSYEKGLVFFKFLAYYFLPLCVIAGFYFLMARHLVLSTRTFPAEHKPSKSQSNQINSRKKVAKMVSAFVITFVVCFLPYHAFMMWFHFYPQSHDDYDQYWNTFPILGFCLSYINSCINPIAQYFVSKAFRKFFTNYLFPCAATPTATFTARPSASATTSSATVTSLGGRRLRRCSSNDTRYLHSTVHNYNRVPGTVYINICVSSIAEKVTP